MAERIPADAELRFIEAVHTGTVHLWVRYEVWHSAEEPEQVLKFGAGEGALLAMLSVPTVTRCGVRTHPHDPSPDARHRFTGHFNDDRLCAACYRTLHPDDQARAFDHPQGDEDNDDAGDEPDREAA